jgi:hypothetical protein
MWRQSRFLLISYLSQYKPHPQNYIVSKWGGKNVTRTHRVQQSDQIRVSKFHIITHFLKPVSSTFGVDESL